MSVANEKVQPPLFTAEEMKKFGELRLNSTVESLVRQRDAALSAQAKAEADLAVRSAQLEVLSSRLHMLGLMRTSVAQELEQTRQALKDLQEQSVEPSSVEHVTEVPLSSLLVTLTTDHNGSPQAASPETPADSDTESQQDVK